MELLWFVPCETQLLLDLFSGPRRLTIITHASTSVVLHCASVLSALSITSFLSAANCHKPLYYIFVYY